MEEKLSKKHTLNMIDRARLNMTGVTDVFAFDEKVIELETSGGFLDIEGDDLHIVKMNLDSGELIVEGRVTALVYQEQNMPSKKGSLIARLFK